MGCLKMQSKHEVAEYVAATAMILRDQQRRTVYVRRNGRLSSITGDWLNRGKLSVLRRVKVWDGHRRLCGPGAHGSGQGGVRVEALLRTAQRLDAGLFDTERDCVRVSRVGDVVTIEHVRFER